MLNLSELSFSELKTKVNELIAVDDVLVFTIDKNENNLEKLKFVFELNYPQKLFRIEDFVNAAIEAKRIEILRMIYDNNCYPDKIIEIADVLNETPPKRLYNYAVSSLNVFK